jgi:hypothetical protein
LSAKNTVRHGAQKWPDVAKVKSESRSARWSWPEIIVSLIAVAIGAGIYLYAHKDEGALEESKQRGNMIVEALERHRIEQGEYPLTLDSLVPAYLDAVEPPDWGLRRWKYERYMGSSRGGARATADSVYFMLSVAASESGYPLLFYDFTERRWVLNN